MAGENITIYDYLFIIMLLLWSIKFIRSGERVITYLDNVG